jgi:hypothetical protein
MERNYVLDAADRTPARDAAETIKVFSPPKLAQNRNGDGPVLNQNM